MICLECGYNNRYGQTHCAGCNLPLRQAPPHVEANHVSQVQVAIEEYLEGNLTRDRLVNVLQRFEERIGEFETRWGLLLESTFQERLSAALQETYAAAMAEIDRSMTRLAEALGLFSEFQQDGPDELLIQGRDELLGFFHQACAGCALALHELDLEQLRQIKVGTSADFSI